MTKNAYEALHAGDDEDGLKDMDVVMESPFPTIAFDDDMKQDEQVMRVGGGEREIRFEKCHIHEDNLLDDNDDVNDPSSVFYTDFPPLSDFPCMSCSSSSSPPLPTKAVSSKSSSSSTSSSSATSWSVFKSEADNYCYNLERKSQYYHHQVRQRDEAVDAVSAAAAALSSTASTEAFPPPDDCDNSMDCMNTMENFGFMDLLDDGDIWDPSSIFESENPQEQQVESPQQPIPSQGEGNDDGLQFLQGNSELAVIFLEWLKQNKDYISAEDMRSIKLKRSTIDCASKRLGSTNEGKKQLLKLILQWVEQYQLQKRRARDMGTDAAAVSDSTYHYHQQLAGAVACHDTINPNPCSRTPDLMNCNLVVPGQDPKACFSPSPSTWIPSPPPCGVPESGPTTLVAAPPVAPFPPPPNMGGYVCDPYSNAAAMGPAPVPVSNQTMNENLYSPSTEYHQSMDSPQSWTGPPPFAMPAQYNLFPDSSNLPVSGSQALYGNPYPCQVFDGSSGDRLERMGSSATKEARKKRMASKRRISLHQYRHHHHRNHQNHSQKLMSEQQARSSAVGNDCCFNSLGNIPGNGIYWSHVAAPAPPLVTPVEASNAQTSTQPVDRALLQPQNHQRQVPSDRKQSWKTEKNLKFLLQKVLKQSDVGNLGRIVLPKKEAETHLPELESRDGIPIAMEDIGTSNVWNMRYRFWPNNKSRMYLLENTGDFVRVNGLQEGDFIVIYSDMKCGKYLIRGVKVRQPETKSEGKKPARRNQRTVPKPVASFSVAPFKQTVK